MQLVLAVIVLVAVHVDVSFGYGTGAPPKACEDMTPGHGTEQTGTNSHKVTLPSGVTTYTPGTTIKVTVTGTFKGVLLQARKDGSNTPYGTWATTVTDTKVTKCTADNDAITHSSTNDKTDAEFTWTPPSEDVGALKFVATVAEEKEVWWRNTESAEVTYKAADTGAGVKEVASATVLVVAFMLQYLL